MTGTKVPIWAMTREQIISAIEGYAKKAGLSPSTVTGRAVANSRLYDRMKNGGDCTTEVAARLSAYMAANPVLSKSSEAA
jgi:hypothetical protein